MQGVGLSGIELQQLPAGVLGAAEIATSVETGDPLQQPRGRTGLLGR
jgi:hypothetical protein